MTLLNSIFIALAGFCAVSSLATGLQAGQADPFALSGSTVSVDRLTSACISFNVLNTRIRDNEIEKSSARIKLISLLAEVSDQYYRAGGIDYPKSAWTFPLAGYDARAIGAGRQHGYVAGGYDFFSGNRHAGHPSYDIFIREQIDKPVKVLSLTGGVVVALEKNWEQGSKLRGGRYIWVYDPANDLLVYYAHNHELAVELGKIVKPGDLLATVGRSGFNAAKKRSPTHLHLTVLRVKDWTVGPMKVYPDLIRARTIF